MANLPMEVKTKPWLKEPKPSANSELWLKLKPGKRLKAVKTVSKERVSLKRKEKRRKA
jgi:hypothetical protein